MLFRSLIGIWAVGAGIEAPGGNANAVLGRIVRDVLDNPLLTGLLTAGILAAIMSSLDSQFVCLGTMFTQDIVLHAAGEPERIDASTLRVPLTVEDDRGRRLQLALTVRLESASS